MPHHNPPSSPSDPDPEIVNALAEASTKEDVRLILSRYDTDAVHQAWAHLPAAQRGALHLVRFTNGRIFHELDNTD